MKVYWHEQNQTDVPGAKDWLSDCETNVLRSLRFPKRRDDWLLGRWTAKNAIAMRLGLSGEPQALRTIEIRATPSGAPQVFRRNQPAPVTFSLSHRAGIAACAVAPPGVLLGCDLETIEPRSDAFVEDYFAAEEHALLASESDAGRRHALLALLWSAKESALKALHEGLRRDTRSVIVSFPGLPGAQLFPWPQTSLPARFPCESANWDPLYVRANSGEGFCGWWTQSEGLLRTVVADPASDRPVPLCQNCYSAI